MADFIEINNNTNPTKEGPYKNNHTGYFEFWAYETEDTNVLSRLIISSIDLGIQEFMYLVSASGYYWKNNVGVQKDISVH